MSLQNIHDEAILSDYRTFTQGVEDFYTNSRKQVSGRVQYRDTPRGFFANAILIKSWSNTPYKTTQHFVDDFIFHSYDRVVMRESVPFYMIHCVVQPAFTSVGEQLADCHYQA